METGGSQILAVDLLNELCSGHDMSLIIVNNKYNDSLLKQLDKRVNIYHIGRTEGSKSPFPIIRLNWILSRIRPDVIHCHEPRVARIIRLKHPGLLYTVHDVGIPVPCYNLYDGLVAISAAVYHDVVSRSGYKISTVFNGVSFKSYRRRTSYVIPEGQPVRLVQVSRLFHEKKGQHILLHAIYKIVHYHGIRNITLDFIGSGASRDFLSGLIDSLKLREYVRLIGERDRDWLFAHLCEYHALIQPSLYEGFGLTILEGFAAGLPVVASDIDGPAEILSEMPGGLLFHSGDADDCGKTILQLLTFYTSGDIEEKIHSTLPLAQKKYSIESCANEYLTEYLKISN